MFKNKLTKACLIVGTERNRMICKKESWTKLFTGKSLVPDCKTLAIARVKRNYNENCNSKKILRCGK